MSEHPLTETQVATKTDPVLVTGYQMHDGRAVLLDESHEEIGHYPSPSAALRSYALEEDHEPGKLEVIWIDETPNGPPTAAASGAT